jgi:hypothetical protein
MSLLDSVRQTISEAATTARDVGQNLGAQAQAQLQLRKLQIDQTRKMHELGARTYEWHRAGQLVATGQVPREVQELCIQLDDLGAQIVVETHKLEEAKRQAELRASKGDTVEAFAVASDVSTTPVPISGGTLDAFPAASGTTGTIVTPVSTPTTEPTVIPISTPSTSTVSISTEPNTMINTTNRTNATMPLTPAPPMSAPASMPFPEPTMPNTSPMTASPMGESGTYALVPGPDMTPPIIPGTPGPDTSPMPTPGGPGPDVSPPSGPSPSGPGTPMPPSSPIMPPPSPGTMPTM